MPFTGKVGASNSELGSIKFGSNDPIDNAPRGFGQAQAKLNAFGTTMFGQAQGQVLKSAGYGQAQADIKAINRGFGQTQADIKVVQPRFGQSQADIKAVGRGFAQANALIAPHTGMGQAQARIFAFDYPQFGQAQVRIAVFISPYVPLIGNALLADFLLGDDTSSQVPPIGYGQAQARIFAFGVNGFGQTQAKIIIIGYGFGQAQAQIAAKNAFAQTQADIKAISRGFGQSQADIKAVNNIFGQAQAQILKSAGYGQANASIKLLVSKFGQAQAFILKSAGYGQALADIKTTVNKFGQTKAKINAFGVNKFAQAQVFIAIRAGYGQAKADIKAVYSGFGQTKADIKAITYKFGQASVRIFYTYYKSGQTQAAIDHPLNTWAQTQARITSQSYMNGQAQAQMIGRPPMSGQANALINARFKLAQAKADIRAVTYKLSQAQGKIKAKPFKFGLVRAYVFGSVHQRYAQAQAQIGHMYSGQAQGLVWDRLPHAQAQARVISTNTQAHAQAQADVITPGYVVRYNGYQLPGYAQEEVFDSNEGINQNNSTYQDGSLSEYIGLENKLISLRMKVFEGNHRANKDRVELAATIVRSKREGFVRFYVGFPDKYYLALTKSVSIQKGVDSSEMDLDYKLEFEAKPWLISNYTRVITGTGTIDTDQVSRSTNDGGWAPARLKLSGTNITVSGYTATGDFAGFLSVSGVVTNLVIDSEPYTAKINEQNKNETMYNLDYAIYVGPAKTYFVISGATTCEISWEDRWYL